MIFIYIIITLVVIIILFIQYFAPRFMVQLRGGIFSFNKSSRIDLGHPDDFFLNNEKLEIITKDNIYLSAYLIKTKQNEQKGTIILLHGIRSNKENNLLLSKKLSDIGYNSVIVDLRAHGASSGKYCTFGFYEKHDIVSLINTLFTLNNLNLNIGIWGQSLGSAVSLQVLETDKRLKFGIIESVFSDFNTISHDYFKRYIGFEIPFITNYIIKRAEKIANFKANEIKPYISAKNITIPVLVAHSIDDEKVNFKYGKTIFNNLQSTKKEFIEIKGATHSNLRDIGGEKYFKKVFKFIEKQYNK